MRGVSTTDVLRRVAVLAVCLFIAGLSVPLASASEDPTPDPPPPSNSTTYQLSPERFSLTISPTRLLVGPGDVDKTAKMEVINRGREAVPVTVQKRNFTAQPDGALSYQDDAPYAAADWVRVQPESFEIAPGATQVISLDVTVPASPELGDHQVAIVFLVPTGETNANVRINRGIGAPVYITVPGPIDESATLSALTAPSFALRGPVDVAASVRNTGTVHRDFRGATPLVIDAAGTPTAFPDFTVLRGGVRDVSTVWTPPLMCICNPTVSIVNADGVVESATAQVIVFPLDLLGLLVVASLVIVFGLRWRRRRYQAAVQRAAAQANWPTGAAGHHA